MPARNVRKSQANVAASGGPISLKKPKSKRQPRPSAVAAVAQEINPAHGFVKFLREQGVVTIAIGFIIALQAQVLVKQLVTSFIDPLFNLFFGQALSTRAFTLTFSGRTQSFTWGAFVYAFLNFVFIVFAIFIIVNVLKLDKLDTPKKDKTKKPDLPIIRS